jgi:hypothetical protein
LTPELPVLKSAVAGFRDKWPADFAYLTPAPAWNLRNTGEFVPDATLQRSGGESLFHRIWPLAIIGICLIATIGSVGFLVFGIIKLVE